MNILVLGSEGLIGNALWQRLESSGHHIFRFDKKIGLDINNDEHLESLEHNIKVAEFVFFLAFDVGGSEYLYKHEHTVDFISNNVRMMERVFGILKEHPRPFVFISSMMTKMPQSTYGILKSLGERYTKALDGISVRFWNVYGAEEIEPGKNHVITDFIVSALSTKQINCKTDGSEVRQFLHTFDSTKALVLIMDNYDRVKLLAKNDLNCVDVSNNNWQSIREIANYIGSKADCKVSFAASKDKVQKDLKIDPQLDIMHLLGWYETRSLFHGIDGLFNLYKEKLGA